MKIIKTRLEYDLKLRTEMDFPVKGIEFIDINTIFTNSKIYKDIINEFINEIKDKNIDYIISPEARGFLLGSPVSAILDIPFIPVRKKNKLPPSTIELQVEYEKEYGKDILCFPKIIDDVYDKKKFYIIDDIYATGNTIKAMVNGIESLGGIVAGIGAFINIKELNNDDIFSILEVNEKH